MDGNQELEQPKNLLTEASEALTKKIYESGYVTRRITDTTETYEIEQIRYLVLSSGHEVYALDIFPDFINIEETRAQGGPKSFLISRDGIFVRGYSEEEADEILLDAPEDEKRKLLTDIRDLKVDKDEMTIDFDIAKELADRNQQDVFEAKERPADYFPPLPFPKE